MISNNWQIIANNLPLVYWWYLSLFIAHQILCAKMFCFIAYICFVYFILLHSFVCAWAQFSFLHGLRKISLKTGALPGLTHQQVKAGEVTLTRWMRKMIQVNLWYAKEMSNILWNNVQSGHHCLGFRAVICWHVMISSGNNSLGRGTSSDF